MLKSCGVGGGGLQHFSVSPRSLGFGFGFGTKEFGARAWQLVLKEMGLTRKYHALGLTFIVPWTSLFLILPRLGLYLGMILLILNANTELLKCSKRNLLAIGNECDFWYVTMTVLWLSYLKGRHYSLVLEYLLWTRQVEMIHYRKWESKKRPITAIFGH